LLVYDDKIEFVKCGIIDKCYKDSVATNRWAVMPPGGKLHPLPGQPDDGPHYEIYKEVGADNYFICLDEFTRRPVTKEGYDPE